MAIKIYSKKKDGSKKLSANFTVAEFACKDGTDKIYIDSNLVLILQKIRDHFGKPVNITSAYRTPAHNRREGGASNSLHVKGMAADIYINGIEPVEIAKYAEKLGIDGIGLYTVQRFVHVDTRTARYYWKNAGNEVRVSSHGGTPTYAAMIKSKCGLSDATIDYLKAYPYPFDLIEKIATALK